MPKNIVSDLITDQEMTFARGVLSGTMTDQQAAEAAGLNPSTAAYTKSKPRVRAYMLEQRALMQQQLVQQETESLRRSSVTRERVLARLWDFADMGPEVTRGSIAGQVKAVSMIIAIEGLIPDRRAGSADQNPAPPPTNAHIYHPPWFFKKQEEATGSQPNPALNQEDQQEDGLPVPEAEPAPGSIFDPTESTFANGSSFTETQVPPDAAFVPDTRVPFSIRKNPFARRR